MGTTWRLWRGVVSELCPTGLVALLLLVVAAGPAAAQAPKAAGAEDEYFAYFVRTTVKREAQAKSPSGPIMVASPLVITEGPWINFSQGLARSLEIRRDGVCKIVDAAPGSPARATCYPPHLVQLVEVVSPPE